MRRRWIFRQCQVPGVTPNETRDPDGTGRIVKFGPDRVEAGAGDENPQSDDLDIFGCMENSQTYRKRMNRI